MRTTTRNPTCARLSARSEPRWRLASAARAANTCDGSINGAGASRAAFAAQLRRRFASSARAAKTCDCSIDGAGASRADFAAQLRRRFASSARAAKTCDCSIDGAGASRADFAAQLRRRFASSAHRDVNCPSRAPMSPRPPSGTFPCGVSRSTTCGRCCESCEATSLWPRPSWRASCPKTSEPSAPDS